MPQSNYYKPQGIPLLALEQVVLTVDELEAIRLTDMEGFYQADAAEKMNVSRQTLGRILESGHRKIADALTNGKALLIKGGPVQLVGAEPAVARQAEPKGPPSAPPARPGHGGRGRGCGGRRRYGRRGE